MECSEIHDVRDHCARTFVRADEAGRMVGVRGQADSVLAMLADKVGVALGAVR